MALQIRRGTDAERTAGGGVVFAEGELVYVTDTDALYVGDGATAGGVKLTDNAGAVLGSYITADTVSSTLDLQQNLDLNGNNIVGTGNINIAGTITATGNVNIGDDANTDTVNLAAQITSSLTPNADTTYNIGTPTARWNNGYFTGLVVDGQVDAVAVNANVVANDSSVMVNVSNNIFTGAFAGNVTGNVLGDLTGDSAGIHTGNVIGNVTGSLDGDITGSVFGDDSTLIVDAINKTLTGNLTGNLKGDVVATNGTIILQNGSDGTDATFTGAVVGVVDGVLGGNTPYAITGTTIVANTGFTGNLTGNVVGNLTGDLTGSVFADNSTLLVDAVAGSIPGANITGTLTNNLTGNATGDHSGTFTGNVFTTLIDSDDSSPITVTPRMDFSSDVIINNTLFINPTGNPGGDIAKIDNTGTISGIRLETQRITHTDGGELQFGNRVGFEETTTFIKQATFIDKVSVQTIAGQAAGNFAVETFTGDPDDDASVANAANYNKHFEATTTKVSFGVPAQIAVVADDTARGTLVPSPAAGMMLFMTAGTSPSATTQLQVYNGTAWVNV